MGVSPHLAMKQKVILKLPTGKSFHAVYLGRSRLSAALLERFHVPEDAFTDRLPVNSPVDVLVGRRKRTIGRFMLAVKRPDEGTILLAKEENLPCVD